MLKLLTTIPLVLGFAATFLLSSCNSEGYHTTVKPSFPDSLVNGQNGSGDNAIDSGRLDPYCLSCTSVVQNLDGAQLEIVSIAIDAFKTESRIPESKRELDDYVIEYRENETKAMISFLAKRDDPKDYVGGETEFGKDTSFIIDKKTMTLESVVQYK